MERRIPSAFTTRIRSFQLTSVDVAAGKIVSFVDLSKEYFTGSSEEWKFLMRSISGVNPKKGLPKYVKTFLSGGGFLAEVDNGDELPADILKRVSKAYRWPISTAAGVDSQVASAIRKMKNDDEIASITIWYMTIEKQEEWDIAQLWESLSTHEKKIFRELIIREEEKEKEDAEEKDDRLE